MAEFPELKSKIVEAKPLTEARLIAYIEKVMAAPWPVDPLEIYIMPATLEKTVFCRNCRHLVIEAIPHTCYHRLDPTKARSVAVDLDGVLAQYDGWKGDDHIGDPIPGARDFLLLLAKDFRIVIHTTRCGLGPANARRSTEKWRDSVDRVTAWLNENRMPYDEVWGFPGKPIAVAYVDDRAIRCCPQVTGPSAYDHALSFITCSVTGKDPG